MFAEDKVAIITGGASGIGFCYVVELLRNGLRGATIADVDVVQGSKALCKITAEFGSDKVIFVKTDVTSKNEIENAFKKTIKKYGNVDILINNAGIMNDSIWEKSIAVNLAGTFNGCLLGMEEYLPKYKSGKEGVIINVSSIAGLQGITTFPIYAATKHAIIGLSKSLGNAIQYDSCKVRVLTICPGVTNTPLTVDLRKYVVNERYVELMDVDKKLREYPLQEPEDVAVGLMKILEEGSNGSIWVVESAETYEIEIPERQVLRKK